MQAPSLRQLHDTRTSAGLLAGISQLAAIKYMDQMPRYSSNRLLRPVGGSGGGGGRGGAVLLGDDDMVEVRLMRKTIEGQGRRGAGDASSDKRRGL